MDEPQKTPEPHVWLNGPDWSTIPEIASRDCLYALDVDFDIDAQLMAIQGLLQRNRQAEEALSNEIKQSEEHSSRLSGIYCERVVDEWVDQIHHSSYQGAAHSMSAVGMLAPLIETIFYQVFQGIGSRFYPATHPEDEHERWKAKRATQWDCHKFVVGDRVQTDLVRGILQLADAVGLTDRLPADLKSTLSALFSYRNKMFHHGFEWPVEERERFAKHMRDESWPSDWIIKSTTGDKPWIFYLSDKFIEHCLATVNQVLDAIGSFVRDELFSKREI
ncbi:MAG: hypothetical protein SGJ26_10515 [Nitrospirota bacterium]|nr:hypothetical protein [Nitrospirota bacterium]